PLNRVDFKAIPNITETLQQTQHPTLTFECHDKSLNETVEHMLRHHPLGPLQPHSRPHLFTGGSKHPKQPIEDAWAVIMVGEDEGGFTFQGAVAGKHRSATDVAAMDNSNLKTTSTTVEIAALIWALAWVIHRNLDDVVTTSTDSLGALQLAKRKIDLQHVHAREHSTWNEVADAAASRGRITAVPVPQQERASTTDGTYQRDWEFLLDADENTKEAYPNLAQGSLAATN
ncbi:unnamed protein product, partial [Prorocentrum cordatum]